jgi:hypothetical protein
MFDNDPYRQFVRSRLGLQSTPQMPQPNQNTGIVPPYMQNQGPVQAPAGTGGFYPGGMNMGQLPGNSGVVPPYQDTYNLELAPNIGMRGHLPGNQGVIPPYHNTYNREATGMGALPGNQGAPAPYQNTYNRDLAMPRRPMRSLYDEIG